MKYILPITDRQLSDVQTKTSKGYFNVVDWNRIRNNYLVLHLIISAFGVDIELDVTTDVDRTLFPTVDTLNTLLFNIEKLRTETGIPVTLTTTIKHNYVIGTLADAPDYQDVNQWETVIDLLVKLVAFGADYRVTAGVSNVGQQRFYQSRWRHYQYVPPVEDPVSYPRSGLAITGTNLRRNNTFRRY